MRRLSPENRKANKLIIVVAILLVIAIALASCAPSIPMTSRADYYVSQISGDSVSCSRQRCELLISNQEIQLTSESHSLVINSFQDVTYHNALGLDQDSVKWYVTVGDMKREPYFMLLQSPTTSIILGYQCYH